MPHCRNCKREVAVGAKFCPHCGQDQSVLFSPDERIQTPHVQTSRSLRSKKGRGSGADWAGGSAPGSAGLWVRA